MALVTINGVGVLSGTITMPLNGVWVADLVIDQPDGSGFDAGTQVTIDTGAVQLSGTVAPDRTGSFLDAVHVRVLAGAAGMSKSVNPTSFAQPGALVRDVVNSIVADASETLSATTDQSFLSTNLTAWSLILSPVSQALETLLRFVSPSSNWRFLTDGTLWIGQETWPSSGAASLTLEQNPADGSYELGVDAPEILPGVTLDGVGQVNQVEHVISKAQIRTRVWANLGDLNRGIPSAIASLVRRALPGIDYLTKYDAKVVSQSSDLTTVDVQPTDPRLPGFGRVALKLGLPGCKVQFAPGTLVRLGWNNGDPASPYACLFDGGETLIALTIGSSADNVVTKQDIDAIKTAINGAGVAPNDGGATLKSNILAAWPVSVGSQTVKVQR